MKTYVWVMFCIYVLGFVLNFVAFCALPKRQTPSNMALIVFIGAMGTWAGFLLFGGAT